MFFRAIVASGIMHGGDGSDTGPVRRTFKKANEDLVELAKGHYSDQIAVVEAIPDHVASRLKRESK